MSVEVAWSIQHKRDTAANWVSNNPILKPGQIGVETDTNFFKFGTGANWNDTVYAGTGGASQVSRVISGGALSVINTDDLVVAACQFYIENFGTFSAAEQTFPNIALSAAGLVRYVAVYGLSDGALSKVEGAQGSIAVVPAGPADSILINASLVSDSGVGVAPDLSGYLLKADKATAADVVTGTNDTKYLTSLSVAGKASKTGTETLTNKRVTKRRVVVTQSATPIINTDNGDIFSITGLAQAITSMTTNLSGTPMPGDMMMIQFTDNAVARAITWGASFQSTNGGVLPTTTVASIMLRVLLQWNSVASKWDCIGVS